MLHSLKNEIKNFLILEKVKDEIYKDSTGKEYIVKTIPSEQNITPNLNTLNLESNHDDSCSLH